MLENNEKNPLPLDDIHENPAENEEIIEIAEDEQTENTEEESTAESSEVSESDDEVSVEDQAETDDGFESDDLPVEDDDENFAAVAERITGARHTIAATAAPIRIRDATGRVPTVPKPTAGIPTRQTEKPAEDETVQNENAETALQEKHSYKRTFITVIASAVALIAILSAVVIAVNRTSDEKRPPDINIGENLGEAEILSPDKNRDDQTETDETVSEVFKTESVSDTVEPDAEFNSQNKTAESETEPEPMKFNVTLDFYDKEDITVTTEAITLADLLASVDCVLTDADVPSVALDSMIAADVTITIGKVEYRTETITETIAYDTEVIKIDTIPRGTTNYIQYGENGESIRTYTVKYLNGVEQNRTIASEETTKWPVTEKYELGVGGSFVGADGVTYTYSYRRVVPATYYNIEGLTYLGTMADETVVAVDDDNIPLGTKLYVKNDKYDFGVRIASDTGSMIDEWEVDIWLDRSNPQFESFSKEGYHYDMEIYYID